MHSWNLEKIYSKQVTKSAPVPPPNRLRVLGESVSLYRKKGEDYELIGDIDDDFYDNTLSKYIKLGSMDSAEVRKTVKNILKTANGNTGDNLNAFHGYVTEGNFTISENNADGENFLLECIEGNKSIQLGDFLKNIYGNQVEVTNSYFKKVWEASPENTDKHNRAGEGELFLAFFCNGEKPIKGDLRVGNRNIEVKGSGGRLYKNTKIKNKKEILDNLSVEKFNDEGELLKAISVAIGEVAGSNDYNDEVLDIISSDNIKDNILRNYSSLIPRGKLPDKSLFMDIANYIQLLAYKHSQKFDSIILFNKSNMGAGVLMQFIDLEGIDTVSDMAKKLKSLPNKTEFKHNADGKGYSFILNGVGVDNIDGEGDSPGSAKVKAASARKADIKDTEIGSLLDIQ